MNTIEDLYSRATVINKKLNYHMEELNNNKLRKEAMSMQDRTQYVIYLDDAVSAQKDIKAENEKPIKPANTYKVESATAAK